MTEAGAIGSATTADGNGVLSLVVPAAADGTVIGKTQLGLAAQLVSTEASGVSLFAAQNAGSASYPMNVASGAPAQTVGTTVA